MRQIPDTVRADLEALDLEVGRPLIAVDADEVLLVFVEHLMRFLVPLGYEMRLVRYELEGSMFPTGSDDPLPFDACIELIDRFFRDEGHRQDPVPGGASALGRLEEVAQIVVLTNVPRHAWGARRRNLDALGLRYQMVVNSGGKGRAMRWLADQVQAPVAFIDDSVKQIESVAKHVPDSLRLHFVWADFIDRIFPECAHATGRARSWDEAEHAIRAHLNGAHPA